LRKGGQIALPFFIPQNAILIYMDKTKEEKKRLVLLDTHAIIHRAYHALPEFMNSKGEPTGAIYGLATMLFKIITELSPDYIVACYDLPGKTFRHEAYDAYKAGRAKTEDALIIQLKNSRQIFEAFGVPAFSMSDSKVAEELKRDREGGPIWELIVDGNYARADHLMRKDVDARYPKRVQISARPMKSVSSSLTN